MRRAFDIALLLALLYAVTARAELSRKEISETVKAYYTQTFHIDSGDLNLRIAHFPDTGRLPDGNYTLEIEKSSLTVPLGYQTLRLWVSRNGRIIRKYPVSVDVSIYRNVYVTSTGVSRNTVVSRDNVELRKVLLDRKYDDLLTDWKDVEGQLFAVPVPDGRILRKAQLKQPADVLYGARVQIRIKNGGFTIDADGKVLDEASVGSNVRVYVNQSGKKLTGLLVRPDLVEVQL